jgi:hypothetical protein
VGPLGPEVGGEGQGDEELRRKRTSSQSEKGSDEVGEGDSGDIINSQPDGNWISRSSNRVCFGWDGSDQTPECVWNKPSPKPSLTSIV